MHELYTQIVRRLPTSNNHVAYKMQIELRADQSMHDTHNCSHGHIDIHAKSCLTYQSKLGKHGFCVLIGHYHHLTISCGGLWVFYQLHDIFTCNIPNTVLMQNNKCNDIEHNILDWMAN